MDFFQAGEMWRAADGRVSRVVSRQDEMWAIDAGGYFAVGRSALECVLTALLHSRLPIATSILDFGCGHGRVARDLRAAFPDAAITFSDV